MQQAEPILRMVDVRKTFLGAHALPPEYAGRSGAYIDLVCNDMMPSLAAAGLIDRRDVGVNIEAGGREEEGEQEGGGGRHGGEGGTMERHARRGRTTHTRSWIRQDGDGSAAGKR